MTPTRCNVRAASLLCLIFFAACGRQAGAPLEISDLQIVEPLPGSRVAAAYMILGNNTREPIVIDGFESPQFAAVELHETRMDRDVARMRKLEALTVPPETSVVLDEGGLHLMLENPVAALETDQPVTLRVRYDGAGTVIVSTTLRSRLESRD